MKMSKEDLMRELLEPEEKGLLFAQSSLSLSKLPKNMPRVQLDPIGCITLTDVLHSFTAGVNEEQAWALCYQTVKSAQNVLNNPHDRDNTLLVFSTNHLRLCQDGTVHKSTFLTPSVDDGKDRIHSSNECKIISNLVHIVYEALEYGMEENAERVLSPELEDFMEKMLYADESSERPETDDEGVGSDGDSEDDRVVSRAFNFISLLKVCRERLGSSSGGSPTRANNPISSAADNHYKAVIRALVAETLELSTFLAKVAQGTNKLRSASSSHSGGFRSNSSPREGNNEPTLEGLHFTVWARLWVQVIQDLRNGVKLKKVESFDRCPPIEYELTPYEILMDDIRSQRYKLKQVKVDEELPQRVKRDAHELILEFIRGRPPLKKAADRVLRPLPDRPLSPIEALLASIRTDNHNLRPTQTVVKTLIRKVPTTSTSGAGVTSFIDLTGDDDEEMTS